jgi:4,5-DOPA dioxygenase extradiol
MWMSRAEGTGLGRRSWLRAIGVAFATSSLASCRGRPTAANPHRPPLDLAPGPLNLETRNMAAVTAISSTEKPAPSSGRMPVLFVGHGSPMNAISTNIWTEGFRALGEVLPRPKAILSVSAHWYVEGSHVTANLHPKTIHDFGGFPPALYAMQYPAPGDVQLAHRVVQVLDAASGATKVSSRLDWGLDHGTWSVLHHMYPQARIPVVQLSIDANLSPAEHLALGRGLQPLRDEGILILGSGNATHNLRAAFSSYSRGDFTTPGWAATFDSDVVQATQQHDGPGLIRALAGENGRMSHPTLDHFLPLLYVLGASQPQDPVTFPIVGFDMGSLSMRSVLIG